MSLAEVAAGRARALSEPRALVACERVGMLASELVAKPRDDFFEPGVDPVIIDMRAEHHEARRQGAARACARAGTARPEAGP